MMEGAGSSPSPSPVTNCNKCEITTVTQCSAEIDCKQHELLHHQQTFVFCLLWKDGGLGGGGTVISTQ